MNETNQKIFLSTGYLAAALLLLYGNNALADDQEQHTSHFQTGFASGNTYTSGGNDSNSYGINGSATVPFASYLSGWLSGSYAHTRFANDLLSSGGNSTPTGQFSKCGINNSHVDAGLFARLEDRGKLGISYGAGKIDSRCNATFLSNGGDTLRTTNYTTNAEYYFSKVTVAAAWNRTQLGAASNLDTSTLTASWYPMNNARISLSADGMDSKDTFRFAAEYQPELLDNSVSFLLGYTTLNQTTNARIVTVGVLYYFDKHVGLIVRDRQYR